VPSVTPLATTRLLLPTMRVFGSDAVVMKELQARQIEVGDALPDIAGYLEVVTDGCVGEDTCAMTTPEEFLKTPKKCVIVGMPGAFTPTCTDEHLPGYIRNAPKMRRMGVDRIAVVTTNDRFIVSAWKSAMKDCLEGAGINAFDERIAMIADKDAEFTKALGMAYYHKLDRSKSTLSWLQFSQGIRSKRFALVAESGIVTHLAVDDGHIELRNTSAESIMDFLAGAPREAGSGLAAAAAPLQGLSSLGSASSLDSADEALDSSQGLALGVACVLLVLAAVYTSNGGV